MARHYNSKKMPSGPYSGMSDRRRLESQDSGMISEDHGAIANLPQNVMIKDWPMARDYASYNLDDSIRGINVQIDDDSRKKKKDQYPEKY